MIKWIIPYLGTTSKKNVSSCEYSFVDVRDLFDGSGNSSQLIMEKISYCLKLLKEQKKVVIYCHYGMSRSNSIAAGILAKFSNCSLNKAIGQVLLATKETKINLEMLNTVRRAFHETHTSNSKATTLITGSSGFIGKNLVQHLKKNNSNIIGINRNSIDLIHELIQLDILVKENNVKTIIHLANPSIYSNNQALGQSLTMLKNILDICRENNIRLFYLSCWAVYKNYIFKNTQITEDTPLNPNDTYGLTKTLSENLIQHYQKNDNLEATIIRLCPVYGIDKAPAFMLNFFEKAQNKETISLHKYVNGYSKIPLLHIDDVVKFIDILLNKAHPPKSINISSENNYSIEEIAKIIIELCNSSSEITYQEMTTRVFQSKLCIENMKKNLHTLPAISLKVGLKQIKNHLFNKKENISCKILK